MKATGYIETCRCCHSTRQVITDYEMYQGADGPVYYVFVNGKTGERYVGSRTDIEFLIELMQMRLKWLKDDGEPNAAVGLTPSADTQGGTQPVGHQGTTPEPPSPPNSESPENSSKGKPWNFGRSPS